MKKILTLVFALLLLTGFASAMALTGEDVSAATGTSGKCGTNLTYRIENDTLTITGSGAMQNYSYGTAPWIEMRSNGYGGKEVYCRIEEVIVGEGVTSIGNYAFCDCDYINSVDLPSTMKTIGVSAFDGCTDLWAELPNGLTTIKERAFACSGIDSITIPGTVSTVGTCAFMGCDNLLDVEIREGVTTLSAGSFYFCENLYRVMLPKSLTTFDKGRGALVPRVFDESPVRYFYVFKGSKAETYLKNVGYKSSIRYRETIASITFNQKEYTYTGNEICPDITVTGSDGKILTEVDNYYLECSNNVNVGTATVNVVGVYGYGGEMSATFTIKEAPKVITSVTLNSSSFTYTGSAIKPSITVKDDKGNTVSSAYYSVVYNNNINAGTASLTVTGKGDYNYKGSVYETFEINPASITSKNVTYATYNEYTGSAVKPSVTIASLTSGTDYKVSYSNNINVGTGTITITGTGNYTGTITKNFYIRKSLSADSISLSAASFVYTGSAITPTVTVEGLKIGTDYTVSYSSNYNVGTAKVTVTGIGDYMGSIIKTFKITAKSLSGMTLTVPDETYTYTGAAIQPNVTIPGLYKGIDYTVAYSNNIVAGTATVTATGKGNYTGTLKKTFTINKLDISGKTVSIPQEEYPYQAVAVKPEVTIEGLKQGTDYTIAYTDNNGIGTATITVTGTGSCTGTITKTFKIKKSLTGVSISLDKDNWTYTGSEIKPEVTISGITENTDYQLSYKNNKDVGTGTVVIKGIGEYAGSVSKQFTIETRDISDDTVTIAKEKYQYTGEAIEPEPTIGNLNGKTDYEVSYEDNTELGMAKIVITGKGNCTGKITQMFEIFCEHSETKHIEAAEATCTVDGNHEYWQCNICGRCSDDESFSELKQAYSYVVEAEGHDWKGWTISQMPTCETDGLRDNTCKTCDEFKQLTIEKSGHSFEHFETKAGLLRNGVEYDKCEYCNDVQNRKTYNGYAAYYVKSFKVSAGTKCFTAKWSKQSSSNQKKFTGYQVMYSLKADMSGGKKVTASKSSMSKKISKLKAKTKYYVQVRTYTKKNGTTFYSKWSTKKSVKTR